MCMCLERLCNTGFLEWQEPLCCPRTQAWVAHFRLPNPINVPSRSPCRRTCHRPRVGDQSIPSHRKDSEATWTRGRHETPPCTPTHNWNAPRPPFSWRARWGWGRGFNNIIIFTTGIYITSTYFILFSRLHIRNFFYTAFFIFCTFIFCIPFRFIL